MSRQGDGINRGNFSSSIGQLDGDEPVRDTRGVSDAELIEASLVDPRSFEVLFDRHFHVVFRFLRGRVGVQVAEDLSAETFVVAFGRRCSYDLSRADARPWLYGIATNLVSEHRRAEERRLRAHARITDEHGSASHLPDHLDPELAAALLELSHEERSLMFLLAWAGLTYEQLAEALDVPVGTVRSRVSRVRSKLSAHLTRPDANVEAAEARGSGLA
jgi:RNA polymerase sigma factor (sigma-70 family)